MKKIKLECWWTSSGSLNQRFIKQFVGEEDLKSYSFVTSNPDLTVVFGNTDWSKLETPKEKTFYFSQEPSWSPNETKLGIHDYCTKIFVWDKSIYPNSVEYIETLVPMFYGGRGDSDHRGEWDWTMKLFNTDFSSLKEKKISGVVSNNYNSHLWNFESPEKNKIIYKNRVDIVDYLAKEFKELHIWGTFQNNNSTNVHGEAWNKLITLKEFKFALCFENTIQKNYVSEKFWDAVLTDTVPIYFGCSNISEHINTDCFIDLTTEIENIEKIKSKLNFIFNNCDTLYDEYLPRLKELKSQFKSNKNFNLWEKIKSEYV